MAELDQESGAGAMPVADTPHAGQLPEEGGRIAEERRQPEAGGEPQPAEGEGSERQQMVPHQALHAVREELKGFKERYGTLEGRYGDLEGRYGEMQRQFSQLAAMAQQSQRPQPQPAQAPDWFQDPDQAFTHHIGQAITPLEQRIEAQREGISQMLAVRDHGAEAVQGAMSELEKLARTDPQTARFEHKRIMASPHPYDTLVSWSKQRATLDRFGSDPEAVINAEVQRRLAEMGHQAAPQQQAAPPSQPQRAAAQQMPTSFATARNGGPRSSPQSSGPRSLSDIMGR